MGADEKNIEEEAARSLVPIEVVDVPPNEVPDSDTLFEEVEHFSTVNLRDLE